MRAIDAKAAVAALRIYEDWRCPATSSAIGAIQEAISIIVHEVPTLTIDDLRPKGRWDVVEDEFMTYASCSECGEDFSFWEADCALTNFCPNCGADMRGGGEDA